MVTATETLSLSRNIVNGCVVGVNTANLGGTAIITTAGNISLVPGVNVSGLETYYSNYVIVTNANIGINLPAAASLTVGWKCNIALVGTGSLQIFNSLLVQEASVVTGSVDMILMNTAVMWRALYRNNNSTIGTLDIQSVSGIPMRIKTSTEGTFFAYSANIPVDLNINATVTTPAIVPWDYTYPSLIDSTIFSTTPSDPGFINVLQAVKVMMIQVTKYDSTGGATTQVELANLSTDGLPGSFTPGGYSVNESNSLIYEITLPMSVGADYRVGMGKNGAPSAGNNFTIPAETFIYIKVIGY